MTGRALFQPTSLSAITLAVTLLLSVLAPASAVAAPEGQLTWAVHVSLAPTWFDPAETVGIVTPFMFLYALHDALVKPMPGNPLAPSLAESWSVSPDGLTYEFVLRKGVRFHNGDPVTAEDVKFSFERYRGASSGHFKARVAAVEVVDPQRVRFRLKQPWPDFMTFYGTPATGAGWIVPKKYVEKVGDDGFKKAPVGAGPYKFVSFTPGVELVLEANEQYWRKVAEREAPGVQVGARRVDPPGDAQARRGRHRLLDPRCAGRGSPADPGAHAQAELSPGDVLARLRRAMGPEVAVGGPARAARRESRHRSAGHQPGRDPGLLEDHREHDPAHLRGLLAAAAAVVRSRRRPSSSSPRPGTRTGSTRATTTATPPTPTWPRRWSTT